MRRYLLLLALLALVLAACGGESGVDTPTTSPADDPTTTSTGGEVATDTPDTTTPQGDTSTTESEVTETTSGRPMAPDFTLELGDGGTYTLSEGSRPVFLVFWAEW